MALETGTTDTKTESPEEKRKRERAEALAAAKAAVPPRVEPAPASVVTPEPAVVAPNPDSSVDWDYIHSLEALPSAPVNTPPDPGGTIEPTISPVSTEPGMLERLKREGYQWKAIDDENPPAPEALSKKHKVSEIANYFGNFYRDRLKIPFKYQQAVELSDKIDARLEKSRIPILGVNGKQALVFAENAALGYGVKYVARSAVMFMGISVMVGVGAATVLYGGYRGYSSEKRAQETKEKEKIRQELDPNLDEEKLRQEIKNRLKNQGLDKEAWKQIRRKTLARAVTAALGYTIGIVGVPALEEYLDAHPDAAGQVIGAVKTWIENPHITIKVPKVTIPNPLNFNAGKTLTDVKHLAEINAAQADAPTMPEHQKDLDGSVDDSGDARIDNSGASEATGTGNLDGTSEPLAEEEPPSAETGTQLVEFNTTQADTYEFDNNQPASANQIQAEASPPQDPLKELSNKVASAPKEVFLPQDSNPWSVAQKYGLEVLDRKLTDAETLELTKELCKENNIKVPEWGLTEGVDHQALRPGTTFTFGKDAKDLLIKFGTK